MSESSSSSSTIFFGVALVVTVVLLILIGGLGLTWARSSIEHETPSPSGIQEIEQVETVSNQAPSARIAQSPPVASAVAPLPPTAVATSKPEPTLIPLPRFSNPVDERLVEEAAVWGAEYVLLNEETTGIWQYEANSFVHPIALEVDNGDAYLLDSGRVLRLDLATQAPPEQLLAGGDEIDGVLVLEPLDLSLTDETLFVLDRAGDVYRYDLAGGAWELDRYDRPVEASSGHYFVAVDVAHDENDGSERHQSRTLLETNYKFSMIYGGAETSLWNLPEGRSVDVSSVGEDVFVLQREMFDSAGWLTKYQNTRSIKTFSPGIEIQQPRQLVATETAVYVLDKQGLRLLALDAHSGKLLQIYQLPQDEPVSTFALDADGQLILGGRDRLYFFEQAERLANIPGGSISAISNLHDPSFLMSLDEYTVPIGGSNISFRDFQMPGAPRHYRLGVHHGLDFYWQPGTKVVAAGDGLVIRADLNYVPPTAAELGAWWRDTQERGYTSSDILDRYLGQQVWIQHESGIVTRYAHLRSIAPDIAEGVKISRGQIIGEVGNSGSPASLESEKADAHLHFEMWLGDAYLGQFMRPIETRQWVERIFPHRR
ncbi:MAG: peptidoglycan DD-metalloendopeptidase family protein [Chloroflexi bacterium]|nr:peptidoglycan DD-metalloendopeptidase family protein [Chloroflexota bacterium]